MLNWPKLTDCHQEPEEHLWAFLTRLEKQLQMFVGIEPKQNKIHPHYLSVKQPQHQEDELGCELGEFTRFLPLTGSAEVSHKGLS